MRRFIKPLAAGFAASILATTALGAPLDDEKQIVGDEGCDQCGCDCCDGAVDGTKIVTRVVTQDGKSNVWTSKDGGKFVVKLSPDKIGNVVVLGGDGDDEDQHVVRLHDGGTWTTSTKIGGHAVTGRLHETGGTVGVWVTDDGQVHEVHGDAIHDGQGSVIRLHDGGTWTTRGTTDGHAVLRHLQDGDGVFRVFTNKDGEVHEVHSDDLHEGHEVNWTSDGEGLHEAHGNVVGFGDGDELHEVRGNIVRFDDGEGLHTIRGNVVRFGEGDETAHGNVVVKRLQRGDGAAVKTDDGDGKYRVIRRGNVEFKNLSDKRNNVFFVGGDGDDHKYEVIVKANVVAGADGHELQITKTNDETTVVLNGKVIPADRLIEKDGKMIVVDEDDKVIYEFKMFENFDFDFGEMEIEFDGGDFMFGDMEFEIDADDFDLGFGEEFDGRLHFVQPKGMIGITMSEIDDELAGRIGVDADGVVVISGVTEGLAAARAGLRAHDVIVEIEGNRPVTADAVREVVISREPGDEIEFVIVREGQPRHVEIEIDEYHPRQFFQGEVLAPADGRYRVFLEGGDDAHEVFELLKERGLNSGGHFFDDETIEGLKGRLQGLQNRWEFSFDEDGQAGVVIDRLKNRLADEFKDIDIDVDEATMERIHEAIRNSVEKSGSFMRDFSGEVDELMEIEIVPHRGDGEGRALILPGRVKLRNLDGFAGNLRELHTLRELHDDIEVEVELDEGSADRLSAIERRLDRLERMIEHLTRDRD